MDSKKLLKGGFKLFGEFNLLDFKNNPNRELLKITGVYALCLKEKFNRLLESTDILYIGQSGGAGKGRFVLERLTDYCKGALSAPQDKRIHDSLKRLLDLKKVVNLLYKPLSKEECKEVESGLLKEFYNDHLELPPFNRQA